MISSVNFIQLTINNMHHHHKLMNRWTSGIEQIYTCGRQETAEEYENISLSTWCFRSNEQQNNGSFVNNVDFKQLQNHAIQVKNITESKEQW